jgi:SAM-dependent methyltransferase
MTNAPWYSEEAGFFGANYLASYTDNLPVERTVREVSFLEDKLGLQSGMSILDCPCGHGRHTNELAKRGYKVTGQDLNSVFLTKAREDAEQMGVNPTYRHGDMRNLPFEAEFDIALNLFTAFGYFEDEADDQAFLNAVAKSLKPNGKFFMDFINRDWLTQNWRANNWDVLSTGLVICHTRVLDFERSQEYCKRLLIYPDGTRNETEHRLRLYTLRELILMCKRAGLETIQTFGDFDGRPASFQSKRVILIAQKQ